MRKRVRADDVREGDLVEIAGDRLRVTHRFRRPDGTVKLLEVSKGRTLGALLGRATELTVVS